MTDGPNDHRFSLTRTGRGRPWLLVSAVGAVIVAAGAIVVWQFTGEGPAGADPDATAEIPFGCIECGGEFSRSVPLYDEGSAAMPVDCRLCGAARCAVALQECPRCNRHVLSEAAKAAARAARTPTPTPTTPRRRDSICPHCNCNMTDHWRRRALAPR